MAANWMDGNITPSVNTRYQTSIFFSYIVCIMPEEQSEQNFPVFVSSRD